MCVHLKHNVDRNSHCFKRKGQQLALRSLLSVYMVKQIESNEANNEVPHRNAEDLTFEK